MRLLVTFLLSLAMVSAAPPAAHRDLLRIPVWADGKENTAEIGATAFQGKVDGKPVRIVAAHGPTDDLIVLVVLDLAEDMTLAEIAKDALVTAIDHLPEKTHVGLLRAQDGLRVVLDPTADRGAAAEAIRSQPVSGKAGLLDALPLVSRVADSMLAKANVRVAVLCLTDSSIQNYREDFTNPVINSSDSHDLSRYFPDGLVREKMSKLAAKMAAAEAPLFIVHVAYRSDRLNEAYQTGLMQIATTCGGLGVFCRSRLEVPDAIASMFRSVTSHYSVVVRMPERAPKAVQVQLDADGHALTYRTRFVLHQ